MATTKKTTTKKTASKAPAKKTTTARKASASKAPTVSKTTRKATPRKKSAATKASKQSQMHSFRVTRDQAAFTSFRITKQTVYWIILVAFIIFVQLWIVKLQVEVASLLDAQQTQLQNM